MALEPVWKSIIANCTPKLWRTSYRKLFSKHALGDKLVIPDIIKWYECQKVFWHSFDTRIATQLRCSRNPPNIRNPLIYCVNRYFLMFGGSQVQKSYRASTNDFLIFLPWYLDIFIAYFFILLLQYYKSKWYDMERRIDKCFSQIEMNHPKKQDISTKPSAFFISGIRPAGSFPGIIMIFIK